MFYEIQQENLNTHIIMAYDHCVTYPLHLHRHIELHYVASGEFEIEIDGKWYTQSQGTASLVFPYILHQTKTTNGMVYSAIINIDLINKYSNTFMNKLPETPIVSSDMLPHDFRSLLAHTFELYHSTGILRPEICESLISAIIGEVLNAMTLNTKPYTSSHKSNDNTIDKIIQYCIENATNDISLDSIAKDLFLSKYYISHMFSDKLKIPFNTFINNYRIARACDLLKVTNIGILDIAYECGFIHQGTFNRVFKQVTNMTPREYRQAYKK